MVDQYDKLELACNGADAYPTNLIRTQSFKHALQSYQTTLQEQKGRLFDSDPKYTLIGLLEAFDGQNAFSPTSCTSFHNLKAHLKTNRKDPKCRHVFIQADNSRAPLDCSKEMFDYLFSFLQVSARFLDFVLAFGKQWHPNDFHYTAFRQENFLRSEDAKRFEIPRLGRSGREIRHCYNVWSVERSDAGGPPWSIRQTAVYHSFDIKHGRSLWINIKANELMQERITEATRNFAPLRAGSLTGLSISFAATLTTHLIIFEWCGENWRAYISSLERDLRKILVKVHNAPLEDVERALSVDANVLFKPLASEPTNNPPSRASTFPRGHSFSRRSSATGTFSIPNRFRSSKQRVLTNLTTSINETNADKETQQPLESPGSEHEPSSQVPTGNIGDTEDRFGILHQFSFDELQRLHGIGKSLHEASLVIKLNGDILTEVIQYYETLFKSEEFPAVIKDECKSDISIFFQRVKSIVRDQEMERSRIDTLMRMLADGKSLFDGILQFRNVEINKLFAVNAHENALRMEDMTRDMHQSTFRMEEMTESMAKIAEKTERDTASMHIITLVTLVFLPGTFVATFFGSGLFQWDQNNPGEMPVWKPEFFALFAEICFPFMAGTFIIWLAAYFWAKRKPVDKSKGDEEQGQSSEEDEKFPKP